MIAGLGMERDLDSLVALYVAGLCGLGYGLRQIIETQAAHGAPIETIVISGGAGRHPLVRQLLADATGLPVVATDAEEPVLLGSAILGAVAGGALPDIRAAMAAMSRVATTSEPAGAAIAEVHARRYEAFQALQRTAHSLPRE